MTTNTTTGVVTTRTTHGETMERVRYARLWWVGLAAIVLSVLANLLTRAIALPFLTVPPEFLPLSTPAPTIIMTVSGVLLAVLVFALVGRFSRRPARTYTIVAAIALVLSLIPNGFMMVDPSTAPFPGANLGSIAVLSLQHVVAAVVAVWVLVTQGIERVPAEGTSTTE